MLPQAPPSVAPQRTAPASFHHSGLPTALASRRTRDAPLKLPRAQGPMGGRGAVVPSPGRSRPACALHPAPHGCSRGPCAAQTPSLCLHASGAQAARLRDEWPLRRRREPAAPAPVRAAARDAAPLRAAGAGAARQRTVQQPHPHRLPRAAAPRRRARALLRAGERRADAAGGGALLMPAVLRGALRDPHRVPHLQPAPHVVRGPHQDLPPPLPPARLRRGPHAHRHPLEPEPSPEARPNPPPQP